MLASVACDGKDEPRPTSVTPRTNLQQLKVAVAEMIEAGTGRYEQVVTTTIAGNEIRQTISGSYDLGARAVTSTIVLETSPGLEGMFSSRGVDPDELSISFIRVGDDIYVGAPDGDAEGMNWRSLPPRVLDRASQQFGMSFEAADEGPTTLFIALRSIEGPVEQAADGFTVYVPGPRYVLILSGSILRRFLGYGANLDVPGPYPVTVELREGVVVAVSTDITPLLDDIVNASTSTMDPQIRMILDQMEMTARLELHDPGAPVKIERPIADR